MRDKIKQTKKWTSREMNIYAIFCCSDTSHHDMNCTIILSKKGVDLFHLTSTFLLIVFIIKGNRERHAKYKIKWIVESKWILAALYWWLKNRMDFSFVPISQIFLCLEWLLLVWFLNLGLQIQCNICTLNNKKKLVGFFLSHKNRNPSDYSLVLFCFCCFFFFTCK